MNQGFEAERNSPQKKKKPKKNKGETKQKVSLHSIFTFGKHVSKMYTTMAQMAHFAISVRIHNSEFRIPNSEF